MPALYDTLARSIVEVRPASGALRMYTCGPTVYRYAHVGNLRTFLLADLIRRAFEYQGIPVHQVQNITDVGHMTDELFDRGEDKMLVAAGLENRTPEEIAAHYTDAFLKDAAAFNLRPAAVYPRASESIEQMTELIARLIERGHAYEVRGTVYYDVRSFPGYGRLSGNTLDRLQPGHRQETTDPAKRHHADFVLWKAAGPRRLVTFASPWGRGYPGWHVECSAMSLAHLGEEIDLHTGGVDLIFPHHEDEIAQSEGAVGHRVVRHWVHGEHLLADGRKMSKSAGNFYDLRDLEARGHRDPLALRLLFLEAQHRAQLNFTFDALATAERTLARWRRLIANWSAAGDAGEQAAEEYETRFVSALENDLDTPSLVALVAEVVATANLAPAAKVRLLTRWDEVLGVGLARDVGKPVEIPRLVIDLVEEREGARRHKDWSRADRLRATILSLGFEVEDTSAGPTPRARRP